MNSCSGLMANTAKCFKLKPGSLCCSDGVLSFLLGSGFAAVSLATAFYLMKRSGKGVQNAAGCDICKRLLNSAATGNTDDALTAICQGADPFCVGEDGYNVLHKAVMGGSLELVQYLVEEAGCDVGSRTEDDECMGFQPIHIAAACGDLPMLQYLIGRGAYKSATTNNLWTVLHFSAYYGRLVTARYCCERLLLSVDAQDSHGETPITLAGKSVHGGWAIANMLKHFKQTCKTC